MLNLTPFHIRKVQVKHRCLTCLACKLVGVLSALTKYKLSTVYAIHTRISTYFFHSPKVVNEEHIHEDTALQELVKFYTH